jgi:hypothetical protein
MSAGSGLGPRAASVLYTFSIGVVMNGFSFGSGRNPIDFKIDPATLIGPRSIRSET